jgi:hypothetical protein
MDMQVHDGLTCGDSVVDTDIVTGGRILLVKLNLSPIKYFEDCQPLIHREFKEGRDMPPWDYQRMPSRHWETIAQHHCQRVTIDRLVIK